MWFSSTFFLATSLVVSCLAADAQVNSEVSQINSDITYIGQTLTYLDGYIKRYDGSNATNLETMNIYNFLFEVLDDTQNAETSVRLRNATSDAPAFSASEAQLLSDTVDGLAPTFASVYSGLAEKKEQLKAVGLNGSPATLVSWYRQTLVSTKTSTGQLYDLIALLSPEPTKKHFTDISSTFASELDAAIAAYTE
ncbi:hypothetical protein CPB83DRAFT_894425 [Crepidotus variabilis]|uniref:Uncharacterized protein n=1 Tax=Crepidotus variabilis TaxID=179855 RepID=A0A9P6EG55_9AGAR|nr:hypothetical protein CPB83DRAFT_894425 [Crepidotus variabilis]